MEQIQLKLEKIADCFDDMSQLFQSVKLEFEMLKEKTVTNNVVTQTEEINSQLSEKDEEKFFKIGHMLVQNTRTISELNEQIQKFQTLKTSFNDDFSFAGKKTLKSKNRWHRRATFGRANSFSGNLSGFDWICL